MKEYKRDNETQALLNTDSQSLQAYKMRRERLKKIESLEKDINILKSELGEIKTLLTQILNRG